MGVGRFRFGLLVVMLAALHRLLANRLRCVVIDIVVFVAFDEGDI